MMKCSKEAFAACPTRNLCGCPDEAVFTEGSECDQFNRQIGSQRRRTEMAPEQRLIDANAYPCQTCEVSHCYQNCNKFTKWFESTVDAVEVPDKELLRAIKLLIKQYEHSKNSAYVHSPVAHALFHTWKQVEERRTDHV